MVFVKEVQRAVLDGRADIAVHSAKDLPSDVADGLLIAAFTERRAANDVPGRFRCLGDLAQGATVASGSVRRRAQLASVRPDLEFVELRGNIDTRLSKIPEGGAIVMALAALQILDMMTERIDETLSVEAFVPAVGQGCVAVECREGDSETIETLAAIDHGDSRRAVEIERAFLGELGSGCSLPVGGHVVADELRVFLADPDRGRVGLPTWCRCRRVRADRRPVRCARRGPSRCGRRAGALGMTSDLSGSAIANEGRLGGCTAVVTRERPGELARLLAAEGAGVVHVPLIEVDDPVPADREKLRLALADEPEWIAVTSAAAVDAIAEHVRTHPRVRVAVVGTATARQLAELVGRAPPT